MTPHDFEGHFNYMFRLTRETLCAKAKEYASDGDRLHNFKVAAALAQTSPVTALGGMMLKHTVSIYDMLREENTDLELWEEKIKDHINYLFLLWALLNETTDQPEAVQMSFMPTIERSER